MLTNACHGNHFSYIASTLYLACSSVNNNASKASETPDLKQQCECKTSDIQLHHRGHGCRRVSDAHTVSSTLAERLQSDLGACGDDMGNIYFYLDCFLSGMILQMFLFLFFAYCISSAVRITLTYLQ